MIKNNIIQSIVYSTVFLFIFSFAFAQSSSNDNTLNCGQNEFLTIGSDGLECVSINSVDVEIGTSISSLSAVCVNGIRRLEVIDAGAIQGIVPNCVVIPVCEVNQSLSYTDDAFQCIDLATFSDTFCPPGEVLTNIKTHFESGKYRCVPFLKFDNPVSCKSNQFTDRIDDEGNPVCRDFPERTITVANSLFRNKTSRTYVDERPNCDNNAKRCHKSRTTRHERDPSFPYLNVASQNIEGINCGKGNNECVNGFPHGTDIELHLDFKWGIRLNSNYRSDECNFIKRSTTSDREYTPGPEYKCELQLRKNLTLQNLAEDLETFYTYPDDEKKSTSWNYVLEIHDDDENMPPIDEDDYRIGYYRCSNWGPNEWKSRSWTCTKIRSSFVEVDPFCIDIKATDFFGDTIFISRVNTRSRWEKTGKSPGHKDTIVTTTLTHRNTIRNPVENNIEVDLRKRRKYQTWIDGDKICSTRGGFNHSHRLRSRVGKDYWTVELTK